MKKFSRFEIAKFKKTAAIVDSFLKQRNKLQTKINKLQEEVDNVNKMIDLTDTYTVAITGCHTEDIIKKVSIPTDKCDAKGNIIYKHTFEFIYPDTIVPPTEENKENTVDDNIEE